MSNSENDGTPGGRAASDSGSEDAPNAAPRRACLCPRCLGQRIPLSTWYAHRNVWSAVGREDAVAPNEEPDDNLEPELGHNLNEVSVLPHQWRPTHQSYLL